MKTLIFLALTHTVVISEEEDLENPGNFIPVYNASSPDELALVNFAKFCGVTYLGLDEEDNIELDILDDTIKIELLHVFEFDSDRKR